MGLSGGTARQRGMRPLQVRLGRRTTVGSLTETRQDLVSDRVVVSGVNPEPSTTKGDFGWTRILKGVIAAPGWAACREPN